MNENIKEILIEFLEQAETNNLTTRLYPNTYSGLTLRVGFGQGTVARIPWISFLGEGQTTGNGIYPVFLFFKKHKKLILAYGISERNTPELKWNLSSKVQTINEYFNDHQIEPDRYGDSYVFRDYDINGSLNWNNIKNDLISLIMEYKSLLESQELVPAILSAIDSDSIRKDLNEEEFLFKKAQEKLKELNEFKETKSDLFKDLHQRFIESQSTYTKFISTLDSNSDEFMFLKLIAQLISYCDLNAADKNRLNDYNDKRTLARSFVRQTQWVENLLRYKLKSNDINALSPSIKNAISYLNNPEKELTMLSENHREMTSTNLLKVNYEKDSFIHQVLEYFGPYELKAQNPLNLTRIISNILYEFPDVKSLWFEKDEVNVENLAYKEMNANYLKNELDKVNLQFTYNCINRFIAALLSKPFIILTGLSGSGKTKLAQAFAYWISKDKNQYFLVPVGADWTNREPLLGFPNSLEPGRYIKPEYKVIDLIIEAGKEENSDKPFFLILDEMNLSHVERYFADILSVLESGEKINLHPDVDWNDDVPAELVLPPNLFIIGTVNIDETTYMFSPKVLDRAHVIEFRVSDDEMENFLKEPFKPDLELLRGLGKNMAADFILKSQTEISDFDDFFLKN